MIESSVRNFCESPHRKLIVVIVTTLFGLVVLLPVADEYFDKKKSRRALMDELDRTRLSEKMLPVFEKRVAQLGEDLAQLESRSVSEESVNHYRSRLVEIIRDSGCQVRRLEVTAPTSRLWLENDDPLKKFVVTKKVPEGRKTPFMLERRNVVIIAGGSMASVHGLLDQLRKDAMFAYPQRLKIRSASQHKESVTLELELWVFALSRQRA